MTSNPLRCTRTFALAALLALSGCGQTGPLFLPGAQPATEQPSATSPPDDEAEEEEQQ